MEKIIFAIIITLIIILIISLISLTLVDVLNLHIPFYVFLLMLIPTALLGITVLIDYKKISLNEIISKIKPKIEYKVDFEYEMPKHNDLEKPVVVEKPPVIVEEKDGRKKIINKIIDLLDNLSQNNYIKNVEINDQRIQKNSNLQWYRQELIKLKNNKDDKDGGKAITELVSFLMNFISNDTPLDVEEMIFNLEKDINYYINLNLFLGNINYNEELYERYKSRKMSTENHNFIKSDLSELIRYFHDTETEQNLSLNKRMEMSLNRIMQNTIFNTDVDRVLMYYDITRDENVKQQLGNIIRVLPVSKTEIE